MENSIIFNYHFFKAVFIIKKIYKMMYFFNNKNGFKKMIIKNNRIFH